MTIAVVTGLLLFLALTVGLALSPVWPLSSLDRGVVAKFAADHRLPMTVESGKYVVCYLVRNLRWRRWGGFAGFAVGAALGVIFAHSSKESTSLAGGVTSTSSNTSVQFGWFFLAGVGYFVGALVAECLGGATTSAGRRAASLRRRGRADYLDPTLLRTAYAILVAGVALLVTASVWPGYKPSASTWTRVLLSCCIEVVVVVIECTTRWVVSRPRPIENDDLAAARDAVRASCVNLLAGVGVAFCWYLLSVEAYSCAAVSNGGVASSIELVGIAAFLMCVRSWFRLRHRAWSVRGRVEGARG